jgi:hypothetical protein
MQDLKRRLQDKEAEVEKLVAQVSRRKEEPESGGEVCVYAASACESVCICGEVCVYVQGDLCVYAASACGMQCVLCLQSC